MLYLLALWSLISVIITFSQLQRDCAAIIAPYFSPDGLVNKCLEHGNRLDHIMDYTRLRALGTLFSMINQSVRNVISYNASHPDFPMQVQYRHWDTVSTFLR